MASFFRGMTENWKLKVMAFAIAVLLWVVVSADQVTTSWMTVPLEVQVTSPDFRAVQPEVREVQVLFTGQQRALFDLAVRRPPLRLTIPEVDGVEGTFPLDPRMVQMPGQITANALDVLPATVTLRFTRLETRLVPVRVQGTDLTGSGWAVVDTLRADPDRIRITGLAANVAGITEVPTLPVQLDPSDPVIDRTVQLDTAGLQGLNLSTRTVRVSGQVDRVVEQTLQNVRIDVGPGVGILPGEVDVRLVGPESVVREITPANFRVVISIGEIPPRIPPEGVSVPLRVDRMRPGVQATLSPAEVLLLPTRAVVGSVLGDEIPTQPETAQPDTARPETGQPDTVAPAAAPD